VKLTVPAGVTQVILDDGGLIYPTNGQIDVQPHIVGSLVAQGYTIAAPDALINDDIDVVVPNTVTAE